MGRWKVFGLVLATTTVGVLSSALLPATSQVSGKTFTLCEKNGPKDYEKNVDNGEQGFSAGDQFIFSEPEFDRNGDRVGKLVGVGTVVRRLKQDGLVRFNVSLNLRGGRIEIQASTKFSNLGGGTAVPIIGGTGKYNDASGVVEIYGRGCKGVSRRADRLRVKLN